MEVCVRYYLDNYAICQYKDDDGYDNYGYLHTSEIDDMKCPIEEKVSIGDRFDAELMYFSRGDAILTVKSMSGKTFEDRLNGLERFDFVICDIIKETTHGSIANINGIPGYIPGNLGIGTHILANVSKILTDKHMLLLNLESVIY